MKYKDRFNLHDKWFIELIEIGVYKNKSLDEVNEYQIYALCWRDKLVFHHLPYMICGEAIDDIMNLLSNKSLDILNDFMSDLIDLPPEFSELFRNKKVFIF